jgi:hypothetical protein
MPDVAYGLSLLRLSRLDFLVDAAYGVNPSASLSSRFSGLTVVRALAQACQSRVEIPIATQGVISFEPVWTPPIAPAARMADPAHKRDCQWILGWLT